MARPRAWPSRHAARPQKGVAPGEWCQEGGPRRVAPGKWRQESGAAGALTAYVKNASLTPVRMNCVATAASSRPMMRVITLIPVCPMICTSRSPSRSVT